jgi:cytochrome P450
MRAITFGIILRAVFGVQASLPRHEELMRALRGVLASQSRPVLAYAVPGLVRAPWHRRFLGLIARADRLLAAEIAERRRDPDLDAREDILSLLIRARFDDGTAMDDRELRDQLMTLLLAGHETTATSLAWTFDLLLHHPEALERLLADLEAAREGYLDAVIKETLRLRPVVVEVGRLLGEPATLDGYRLPAGTPVMAAIWLANTRAESYPDPWDFRPERFLDSDPDTYSWIPFGGGRRRCVGAAFAQYEMQKVISVVLRRVSLAPARRSPEPMVRRGLTINPKHGAPAIVTARL